jgi:hypothetical protein
MAQECARAASVCVAVSRDFRLLPERRRGPALPTLRSRSRPIFGRGSPSVWFLLVGWTTKATFVSLAPTLIGAVCQSPSWELADPRCSGSITTGPPTGPRPDSKCPEKQVVSHSARAAGTNISDNQSRWRNEWQNGQARHPGGKGRVDSRESAALKDSAALLVSSRQRSTASSRALKNSTMKPR